MVDNLGIKRKAQKVDTTPGISLPPETKLGQGNIFRSLCQEFCPQEGGMHGRGRCAWQGACMVGGVAGGMHGRGCMIGGGVAGRACVAGGMCGRGVHGREHAWCRGITRIH